ncbi:Multidrug efflux pump subunit AcrB [Paenibacillus sp. UNCCL117]|uniref:efflux RND transporter permease subunit n=1 Tax=unclassified Paenibacillus TaxID=185978 RepID=UPI00088B1100|nr:MULTISPECIES: efflux RND transporter permease subunit [unclassified Paenibacillus]SDC95363.1 Multidrug efflux pump subunit AcrB [Paenibacillus sp. cl123]SFW30021.1 Multidrug efflux pump subunit AcrB [Paenibacillus sp. UNCCL117]
MIEYVIKKRKITLLFLLMALVVGFFGFSQLPRQVMPDVVIKQALVTTVYPGASPTKVEQTVTKVIEQKIKEIQGIQTITSSSHNGYSSILIKTEDDADAAKKWDELRKKVQDAQAQLPADAEAPVVNDELTKSFVEQFAITSERIEDLHELSDLMLTWKDQLRTVPGVAGVDIKGLPEREVKVVIDAQKLQQLNIPWEQVMNALQNYNNRVPTGSLVYQNREYQLTVPEAQDAEILNHVVVTQTQAGTPVYIRDIGNVTYTYKKMEYFAYYNGKPAVTISLTSETGSDVPTMNRLVNEKMKELAPSLPGHLKVESLFAQEDLVNELFADLSKELLIAIVAVVLICTLGLNLLTSATVALAIPVSIGLGFIFLPALGITLNQISIVGLIIVLGLLVDDAVVVNDNIERRMSVLGESPSVAAVKGTKEVAISILTATLATIAAFAPLLFLQGDIGAFIKPIPTIVSLTMLASMLMSLTIIPIFRAWYDGKRQKTGEAKQKPSGFLGKQIQTATNVYSGRLMSKVLDRPLLTGLAGLLIGTAAYSLALFTPIELFPDSERPEATINVQMPIGTSVTETDRVIREIAEWISAQPETDRVTFAAGGGAPTLFSDIASETPPASPATAQLQVLGVEGQFDRKATVAAWQTHLAAAYPETSLTIRVPQLGIPVGSPVSVRLTGENLEELQGLAEKVKVAVAGIEGTLGVKDDMGFERYNLTFQPNQEAMDRYMVSYKDLTRTLLLVGQGLTVSEFDTGKDLVDMNLYIQGNEAEPVELYQQVQVTNAQGRQVPLSQLTTMTPGFSIPQINHHNLERTVTITADISGRTATEVMAEVQAKLSGLSFPDGYAWSAGGETSEQADIFASLGKLSIIVGFLIVLLMTMQFYSLTLPLLIMTTVYLAAAGGIIGMFLTRMPIGFMSLMGIISLAGVVVRNGIVLIEFIEEARHDGMELKEAVMQAASARFRPIILTSLTAIVGMIPIATIGDILFRPLAMTIIFGMMFSTVLTLFVVPSLYMVQANLKAKRKEKTVQV